jgi:hypothetical protein
MRPPISFLLSLVSVVLVSCATRGPRPGDVPVALTSAAFEAAPEPPLVIAPEPPIPTIGVPDWTGAYPDAAGNLAQWRGQYPTVAGALGRWAEAHPQQFYALLMWSVTHPYEDLDALYVTRWGWDALQVLERTDPDAVADFLEWTRTCRPAAESLAGHPEGLSWLNDHARVGAERAATAAAP